MIHWEEVETTYAEQFSSDMGAPDKPFRMALGSLIIKAKLGTSDDETVEQIRENPYLQCFLMYKTKSHRVDDRIISLSQPQVRPIVRGKVGVPVEFGAKLSVSCV